MVVANCGRSASEKLGSADSIVNNQVQTCDGISNRLLYSRDSKRIGRGVVERLGRGVERQLLAGAVGDVAEEAEPGAQVADLDVGVRALAALDAIEEVLNVLRLAFLAPLAARPARLARRASLCRR